MKYAFLGVAVAVLSGCATANYQVVNPKTKEVLQTVQANAPGGDTFVMVVYYGPSTTPIIHAGGDSTALVDATAAAGRRAVDLAMKVALKP